MKFKSVVSLIFIKAFSIGNSPNNLRYSHIVKTESPRKIRFVVGHSSAIAKLYADAGLKAELVIIEGAGHGGKRFYHGEHFEQAKRFLNTHAPRDTPKIDALNAR